MLLTIRRTWPEEPFPKKNWLIIDDGEQVGRVYQDTDAAGVRWFWAINGWSAWCAASCGMVSKGDSIMIRALVIAAVLAAGAMLLPHGSAHAQRGK